MKHAAIALSLFLFVPAAASAQEGQNRSLAACKSITGGADKANLAEFSEDELKEKMCLSSLSVVRSADQSAALQCRMAFKALFGEFSKRHPGKEMTEVYGRC